MSKFKVGDRVVETCFKYKIISMWSTMSNSIGTVVNISDNGYYSIRFDSYLKYHDYKLEEDFHELHEDKLISFDVYNSPLYQLMREEVEDV